jgi:hypothetical protein
VLGLIFGEITKSCRWSSAESSYSPMISFTTYHFPCSKTILSLERAYFILNLSQPHRSTLRIKRNNK